MNRNYLKNLYIKCAPSVGKILVLHPPSKLCYTHLAVEKISFFVFISVKNLFLLAKMSDYSVFHLPKAKIIEDLNVAKLKRKKEADRKKRYRDKLKSENPELFELNRAKDRDKKKSKYQEQKNERKKLIQVEQENLKLKAKLKKSLNQAKSRRNRIKYLIKKNGNKSEIKKVKKTAAQPRKTTSRIIMLHEKIIKFYLSDLVSSPDPSKRGFKTRKGRKMRKRNLIISNLHALHQKFKTETNTICAYSTFVKWKPFYVVKKGMNARETCLCITHLNAELLFKKALELKLVPGTIKNFIDYREYLCCNANERKCAYKECDACMNKQFLDVEKDLTNINDINYFFWENVTSSDGKKRLTKNRRKSTVNDFVTFFVNTWRAFLIHEFRNFHQFSTTKDIRKNLKNNEVYVVIDWSENYTGKYKEEPQGMHFGDAKPQISLHTGVAYFKSKKMSFCTASDFTKHNAEAIWAHLLPILKKIREENPQIDEIHIKSDGPSSQYKNTKNFKFFINHVSTACLQF